MRTFVNIEGRNIAGADNKSGPGVLLMRCSKDTDLV